MAATDALESSHPLTARGGYRDAAIAAVAGADLA
jgi:hypothetical protein